MSRIAWYIRAGVLVVRILRAVRAEWRASRARGIPTWEDPLGQRPTGVLEAAEALLEDVRRRYPGEELRCPHMQALDAAVRRAR